MEYVGVWVSKVPFGGGRPPRSVLLLCYRAAARRVLLLVIGPGSASGALFTASAKLGRFPEARKHANYVVTPKGGKRDPLAPRSYRPISLLSNISKIFEKLMAHRISKAAIRVGP